MNNNIILLCISPKFRRIKAVVLVLQGATVMTSTLKLCSVLYEIVSRQLVLSVTIMGTGGDTLTVYTAPSS